MFIERICDIIKKTKCSKDFKCLNDRFDNLCKMDYFSNKDGDTEIFECLDNTGLDCDFSVLLKDRYLCKCPVRIRLLKRSLDKEI
jgi:hypothetical protein